jgi:diaminohydroxyphosphoribosylaminopyrimidine deaminase/5-amino-6-(5-phosphoribosylamino)uracil reductase
MSQAAELAWSLVRAAAREAESAAAGRITHLPSDGDRAITWCAGRGWQCALPPDDDRRPLIELYLPFCSATAAHPMTLGHLGESLDGFIATHSGDSQWVTGRENVVHMHRLRALADAVVVGAGTVAADDPQLTTRLVEGPSPLRVVIDPGRRLAADHRVFTDASVPTVYFCAYPLVRDPDERIGGAEVVGVPGDSESVDLRELLLALRVRRCSRVFVEGGGVTISSFLQANLLDRLHLAIAPLLIGDGRAAIRFPAPAALGDCHRPSYRVFRMGGDVLFDCDLRSRQDPSNAPSDQEPPIVRVI